jgi:hypothetical protein
VVRGSSSGNSESISLHGRPEGLHYFRPVYKISGLPSLQQRRRPV